MSVAEPLRHHWTVEEYHRLAESGALDELKVELIEGEILDMASMGPRHVYTVSRLNRLLAGVLPPDLTLRIAAPSTIEALDSEPEPDFVVIEGVEADFLGGHPEPSEALLAIEVADASLRFDRGRKASLYRRAGLRAYWVVDVAGRQVFVHTPTASGEWAVDVVPPDGVVEVPGLGLRLRPDQFLPPAASD